MKEVKERSIIFPDEMVRAILDGRKTQTRRVVNPKPILTEGSGFSWKGWMYGRGESLTDTAKNFSKHGGPFGKPGGRLWVRETYGISAHNGVVPFYKSTEPDAFVHKWIRSSYMPRSASRIDLEIINVRIERVQDISKQDAKAEGSFIDRCDCLPRNKDHTPMDKLFKQNSCNIHGEVFSRLWDSGNIKNHPWSLWDKNPFVWVIEFKRIKP